MFNGKIQLEFFRKSPNRFYMIIPLKHKKTFASNIYDFKLKNQKRIPLAMID